jgi:type II secretory pathway pseudopilin PulG
VSLIGTLAALAMLAAVATVVSSSWTLMVRLAGQRRGESVAASLAESKLAELAMEPASTEIDGDRRAFDEPHERYDWTATTVEWPGDPRMARLDVTVGWQQRGRRRELTLSTLLDAQGSQTP